MKNTTYIELSRSALKTNFEYLTKMMGSECSISHVVKGNAYGHGIRQYVPLAAELGARHFSTFDAHEALEVCKVTERDVTVMIMGMIENEELEWAVEREVEFYVFELSRLEAAIEAAKRVGKKAIIHLELETGMNRTGLETQDYEKAQKLIKTHSEELRVKGFCTHYAGAEDYANFLRVEDQYKNFTERVGEMNEAGIKAETLHTACSAASVRLPHTRMDMVRIGIMQYGFWPSVETYISKVQPKKASPVDPLKRVISWKSGIMSVKQVEQGDYIGYGTSYLATQDMRVATVPIGYSHGFSRSLSNQGRALVRGVRVSVIGIVNMNVIMLDVSQLDHVEKGDEVVLIGHQGDQSISVSSFSEYSDQLNYELLTRLPEDIPRLVVN